MTGKQKVTLAMLAERLNVTTTTVSKALNGKSGIGLEMVERVRQLAREMNYQPNSIARSLRSRSTDAVGVLITGDIASPWYSKLVSKLEEKLAEHNKTMMLSLGKNNIEKEKKCFEMFKGGQVAGVIVGPVFRTRGLQGIWQAINSGMPILTFNRVEELPVSYVAIDQQRGAELAVEYLINSGHKNITYLCCPENDIDSSGYTRREGFIKALHSAGLPLFPASIIQGDRTKQGGYDAAKNLLAENKKLPTALFCHNDSVALGAILALQQAGLNIPDDVSIIGFDNIEESSFSIPALTTVGDILDHLATSLVETFLNMVEQPPNEPIKKMLVPQLIKRASVKQLSNKKGGNVR